ncbi:MAG: hypothetical protein ABL994_20485, partial [Verrucomicrobiales bacterium]
MIIWSGHGILIPVFGVAGMIVGGMIGAMVGSLSGSENWGMGIGMILGGLLASGLIWLYALTFGKTQESLLVDPRTGQEVLYRKANTFFFIPAFGWAVISSVGATLMLIPGIVVITSKPSEPVAVGPGATELKAAERLISNDSHGIVNGNTPEAKEMAKTFSDLAAELRGALIEEGKSSTISISGGEFLTYCQESEHGIAFLVHVPGLRKFTKEAKQAMSDAAWFAGNQAIAEMKPAPENLAVAVKGLVLYETIMVGVPGGTEENPTTGIRERYPSHESSVLHPFFAAGPQNQPKETADPVPIPELASATKAEPSTEAEPVTVLTASSETKSVETETAAEPLPVPPSTTTPAAAPPTEVREWKSADGRILQASFIRFVDEGGTQA